MSKRHVIRKVQTFFNYQFKYTAFSVLNYPAIQTQAVVKVLKIHRLMWMRWKICITSTAGVEPTWPSELIEDGSKKSFDMET